MRIAVPVWSGRVSPVLDSAQHLVCFDFGEGDVSEKVHRDWTGATLCGRVLSVLDLDVDVLICGAISRACLFMLQARGVGVQPFLCGEVGEILDSYRRGSLGSAAERLPGTAGIFGDQGRDSWIQWFSGTYTRKEG